MNWKTTARVFCGVLMLANAAAIVLDWLPTPKTPEANALLSALIAAEYIYPLIFGLCFAIGLSFLANRFVSVATFMLVGLTYNVILYHAFLSPGTLPVAVALLVPLILMFVVRWKQLAPFLRPEA